MIALLLALCAARLSKQPFCLGESWDDSFGVQGKAWKGQSMGRQLSPLLLRGLEQGWSLREVCGKSFYLSSAA